MRYEHSVQAQSLSVFVCVSAAAAAVIGCFIICEILVTVLIAHRISNCVLLLESINMSSYTQDVHFSTSNQRKIETEILCHIACMRYRHCASGCDENERETTED